LAVIQALHDSAILACLKALTGQVALSTIVWRWDRLLGSIATFVFTGPNALDRSD